MNGWRSAGKKKSANIPTEEITYFATNIPGDATKSEIWKTFERFGRLSDIYMGQNLGKNGKHYAFLRFKGVGNMKELEMRLN